MNSFNCLDSEIRFDSAFGESFQALLQNNYATTKKVILTDENVYELWGSKFITTFEELHEAELIVIPPGEENKTLQICEQIWGAMSEYEIGRGDLLINLGGGVVCDVGGFVASTFKRGMSFINIPTTLLSQVDASVGGKTGVDLASFKNQIGVFASAEYVYIDPSFLETLDEEQIKSGFAEMLKHGIIADRDHFGRLKEIDLSNLEQLSANVEASVKIKAAVVEADYKESGDRKKLNLGHTFGHAIEGYALSQGRPIPHGYAVAYGIIGESYLSYQKGLCQQEDLFPLKEYILSIYPPIDSTLLEQEELLSLMKNDKKNALSQINFTLMEDIGSCLVDQECTEEEIRAALDFIRHPST